MIDTANLLPFLVTTDSGVAAANIVPVYVATDAGVAAVNSIPIAVVVEGAARNIVPIYVTTDAAAPAQNVVPFYVSGLDIKLALPSGAVFGVDWLDGAVDTIGGVVITNTSVTFAAGPKSGRVGVFSGASKLAATVVNMTGIAAYSLSIWINEATPLSQESFMSLVGAGTVFIECQTMSGPVRLYNGASVVTAAGAVVADTWAHFVATIDAAGAILIYKNGVQVATGAGTAITWGASVALQMGEYSAGRKLIGSVGPSYVFGKVLTPEEVALMYTRDLGVFE